MTSKLSISSSVSSATLVAINSISAATVAANDEQNHHAAVAVAAFATDGPLKDVSVEQDDITTTVDITEREDRLFTPKSSTAAMKPDVGILSRYFTKNKGQEQPVGQQFAIHRKKRAAADVDVDVGILDNRRWHESRANLHDKNEVLGRSLQSEDELPYMCPIKNGRPGSLNVYNLFNKTDGYFPKCSCPSPTTCGPELCECLELDADGDILQCMDPLKQLCEGTKYISEIPGPWSMEECLGNKFRAIDYCSYLPCFADGGSWSQCGCNFWDSYCTEYRDARSCATSKCCQAQTDDEGREACIDENLWRNYYNEVTSLYIPHEEVVSRFSECAFNSENDKTIVQCYCESFSYGRCVNSGVAFPVLCEAMNCCFEQTEDDTRLDCFTTRFRDGDTGFNLYRYSDEIQESCVASGKSSDQCNCDIHGLSNCVYGDYPRESRCDLFQCCQLQTDDNDDGRKECLAQDEAQLMYETCINYGNTTEACYCDKSNTLCSSGHSNGRHCELSSCCQEQADDIGRKECIGNFTTSQPSSAPSETAPSPTATSISPGTSSASTPTPFGAKSLAKTTSKMLAVTAAVIGWLIFT